MPKFVNLAPAVESVAMKRVKTMIESVAPKKIPVLLYGEAGAGKTFWAKFIHSESQFAELPFLRISCKNLGGDELAQAMSINATIYLQDFAEIDSDCQAVLLNAMAAETADFRLIASSRCSLEERVGEAISPKLYNALSLMPISIPPLRERREDALFLAEFFLKNFAERERKDFEGFSDDALAEIYYGFWRENVRELKTRIENAVKTQDGPQVSSLNEKNAQFAPFKDAVAAFKKNYIGEVFQAVGRRHGAAADVLKLQRTYLSKLMKDLEIK